MKAVRRGFIKSIPILCSYLFVGMAYGITMQNAGFFVALSYKWTACNMSRLDERFELDAVLLHYIEQDEVYWYGDICEEMGL